MRLTGVPCAIDNDPSGIELDETRAVVLYRIVQESLNNITKYAQATAVQIAIAQQDGHFRLTVTDNGVGFDLHAQRQGRTYGLLGMRERALVLSGQLSIRSALGAGTQIGIQFPVHPATQ